MRGLRPFGVLIVPVVAGLGWALTPAAAAVRLTQEPPAGQLRPGTRALVDDGACPAGQIKEVVDVATRPPAGSRVAGVRRIRHCIRR